MEYKAAAHAHLFTSPNHVRGASSSLSSTTHSALPVLSLAPASCKSGALASPASRQSFRLLPYECARPNSCELRPPKRHEGRGLCIAFPSTKGHAGLPREALSGTLYFLDLNTNADPWDSSVRVVEKTKALKWQQCLQLLRCRCR